MLAVSRSRPSVLYGANFSVHSYCLQYFNCLSLKVFFDCIYAVLGSDVTNGSESIVLVVI